MPTIVKIFPTLNMWAEAAAAEFCNIVEAAVEASGTASVALSGGQTPVKVYKKLSQSPWIQTVPWDKINWFWVDERWVPAEHEESNFGLAWKQLLSQVPVSPNQIFPIPTEAAGPEQAAVEYEKVLRKHISVTEKGSFDLVLLGMGTDGHTASLFPGSLLLAERQRWVSPATAPTGIKQRVTLTLPLLNSAKNQLVLVNGAEKKDLIKQLLYSGENNPTLPAGRLKCTGQTFWLLDAAAAGV